MVGLKAVLFATSSQPTLQAVWDVPDNQKPHFVVGWIGLKAIDAISIGGCHNGIMDDKTFELFFGELPPPLPFKIPTSAELRRRYFVEKLSGHHGRIH